VIKFLIRKTLWLSITTHNDAKNAKTDENVLKTYFFWIFNVFAIFGFFLKIYQNIGQKLGSNIYDEKTININFKKKGAQDYTID
jgi:hypothetical protein